MLLKIQWVNDEFKEAIKKYLEANDNENKTIQIQQKQFLEGSS